MRLLPIAIAVAAAATVTAAGGCAHLQYGSVAPATPTPSVTTTPSAAPCNLTPATNAQIIAMSPAITPDVDPTYGIVAGYGLVTSGNVGNVAAPITVLPNTTVQFFNNDQTGSQLRYSAAGIPNVNAFPPAFSYTFPTAAGVATGSAMSTAVLWSTGLLAGQCYSQPFTVPAAGVYYFGDVTYYSLANIRDVIVAATPKP